MTESNVKIVKLIDKHPFIFLGIFMGIVILSLIGVSVMSENYVSEKQEKLIDSFSTMSCDKLIKISTEHAIWMDTGFPPYPSDFYNSWNKEMQRCLK